MVKLEVRAIESSRDRVGVLYIDPLSRDPVRLEYNTGK